MSTKVRPANAYGRRLWQRAVGVTQTPLPEKSR